MPLDRSPVLYSQLKWTPIHYAAYYNRSDVIGALLADSRIDFTKTAGVRACGTFWFFLFSQHHVTFQAFELAKMHELSGLAGSAAKKLSGSPKVPRGGKVVNPSDSY